MSTEYGYVRVSTREQNEERQLIAMRKFGIEDHLVFLDKQTGKNFDRPAYVQLIQKMRQGDTLVVKSIDRLGRNYCEVLENWRMLTKEKQVSIVVIDMPLLDTRNKESDITGLLISDIVLQILSYVAQKEIEFIRQRQAEGIAAAKERGVKFGRESMVRPKGYKELRELWQNKGISARKAAGILGVTHTSFLEWMKKEE